MANQGKITEIIGPVIDVSFEENNLPKILNALEIKKDSFSHKIFFPLYFLNFKARNAS